MPGFLSPTELSMPPPEANVRLLPEFPDHGWSDSDFVTKAPKLERSPKAENSAPTPYVPAAFITGLLSSTRPTLMGSRAGEPDAAGRSRAGPNALLAREARRLLIATASRRPAAARATGAQGQE